MVVVVAIMRAKQLSTKMHKSLSDFALQNLNGSLQDDVVSMAAYYWCICSLYFAFCKNLQELTCKSLLGQ